MFLSFDLKSPPWNDIHIRRMVAYASDRAGYVNAYLNGHGKPATAMVPPEQWANLADKEQVDRIYSELPQYPFDLEKAKQELAQSAHPDGFTATIQYSESDKPSGKALVSLSETLKQLGVRLQVREVPSAKWLADVYAHKSLGLQVLTYGAAYVDPATHLLAFFPSALAKANGLNVANLKDPRLDSLLIRQQQSGDKTERVRLLTEILRFAGEQLPYLPFWWIDSGMAINDSYVYDGYSTFSLKECWLSKIRARA
jgi:peptide/nickel transport system substrate-binding protein